MGLGTGVESGTFSTWLRAWGLHAEFGLAIVAGVGAAFAGTGRPWVALLALALWLVGNFHRGRAVTTPLGRQLKSVLESAALPLALVAAGVGFVGLSPTEVPQTFAALGAAALVSVTCRSLRWKLQSPIRVAVVGDRAAIASAVTRWAGVPSVRLVGGLLVEQDLAEGDAPREILGVATWFGTSGVRGRMAAMRADLVVITPNPGLTAESFRRLTWELEEMRVSVGVTGVLENVAPQRIVAGGLGRATIMDVRAPRPSRVVRASKAVLDRTAAALLLLLVSPLLAGMALAVRLDSRGPALFRQVRVGMGGRTFEVLKMRTMVQDAEELKATLQSENEADSVLFKMKRDPRITRVGAFLRKTSLDELPQLINVLRGDMSLVGPRPHLPGEIAEMDSDTLRRLAVRPGITGLWQVSGRSDLTWAESAALDTYYADNWSLSGDLMIGARTVKAVASTKGAY